VNLDYPTASLMPTWTFAHFIHSSATILLLPLIMNADCFMTICPDFLCRIIHPKSSRKSVSLPR